MHATLEKSERQCGHRLLDQRGRWNGKDTNTIELLGILVDHHFFEGGVAGILYDLFIRIVVYFLFPWGDQRVGGPVWHQSLESDLPASEWADGESVSWPLAHPLGAPVEEVQLDPRGGSHHLQSPFRLWEPLGWDFQAASWKVGCFLECVCGHFKKEFIE